MSKIFGTHILSQNSNVFDSKEMSEKLLSYSIVSCLTLLKCVCFFVADKWLADVEYQIFTGLIRLLLHLNKNTKNFI